MWWCTAVVSPLSGLRLEDGEFKACLAYMASSRPASATKWNLVFNKRRRRNQRKFVPSREGITFYPWGLFSNHQLVVCLLRTEPWKPVGQLCAHHCLTCFFHLSIDRDAGCLLGKCPKAFVWAWDTAFGQEISGSRNLFQRPLQMTWRSHLLYLDTAD